MGFGVFVDFVGDCGILPVFQMGKTGSTNHARITDRPLVELAMVANAGVLLVPVMRPLHHADIEWPVL